MIIRSCEHIMEGLIGIGAGETIEEAVCRGLQVYLDEELRNRKDDQRNDDLSMCS